MDGVKRLLDSKKQESLQSRQMLAGRIGSGVVGIKRIFYVFEGNVDSRVGPLQIEFADGVVLFDAGSDGETLKVSDASWTDPFLAEDPPSDVNKAYVEKHGKWTAFDVAGSPEYLKFLESVIQTVTPRETSDGRLTGVVLKTTKGDISVMAEWDELIVGLEPALENEA
ncbi:hypothetical protein ITJ38_17895 [Agreia pratensis]|uniref:hypothetical protein n=1 Tax=Agreia pratensis TaxID=150121 RepID=UPI00188BAA54|nr:hypothetical protein [Agreia pratensis]MBF4636288.1 hypothetical protein [Agreia pratensis]